MSLWQINGHSPVRFSVPMLVKPLPREEMDCCLGMIVPPQIEKAVGVHMQHHGRTFNAGWILHKVELAKIGSEVPEGRDPFELFSWDKPCGPPRPYEDFGKDWDRKDFIDGLHLRGAAPSRELLEWFWSQFMNHALDWLVNKERALDMGFCRLIPTPYRTDWRLGRHDHFFCATRKLLDWDRLSATCRRFIEVETRPLWLKAVRTAESFRVGALGDEGYCQSVFDSMARARPAMMRIYEQYARHRVNPCPGIIEGDHPGIRRFSPYVGIRKGELERAEDHRKLARKRNSKRLCSYRRRWRKRCLLQPVRGLRGWYANLRATGRNAYQQRRNGRAFRVLVLPAGEKPPEGCVLVGGADKLPKGMAEGTERPAQ